MLYEIKNISTVNVGLPKVLLRIGTSRIVDDDKITASVRSMEQRGLIEITEYKPKKIKRPVKVELSDEEKKNMEATKEALAKAGKEVVVVEPKPDDKKSVLETLKNSVLDSLVHKKKTNTIDKIVQRVDGSVAGYKPAEPDPTVTKNNDYDHKPDLQKAGDVDKYSSESLQSLKISQLRKIGDDLGVKDSKKDKLISKILEKQG